MDSPAAIETEALVFNHYAKQSTICAEQRGSRQEVPASQKRNEALPRLLLVLPHVKRYIRPRKSLQRCLAAIRPLSDIPIHSFDEQRSKECPSEKSLFSIDGFISATVSRIAVNDSAFTNHQNTSMSGRYSTRTLPLCGSESKKGACPADSPPDRRSLSLRCASLKSHE